ncbi:MAG: sigma-54-dependent Fis family transcriptional regulator [Alphaproteobacteria bacterium]|nr:sigma-54-dependent Fis family transcriptional regulator [Alphaproteobacteria bacterium]
MAFNILIVDDEADIRDLVSGILGDNGYETTTAGDYLEAYDAIRKSRPGLVVLDVWLGKGETDGLRLLEDIKKNYEYVPVVMISGHSTVETAVSAIKKGAYDFIEKPFDTARLLTSVEKAIDMSRLQMENSELKTKAKVVEGVLGTSLNSEYVRKSIGRISVLNGRCVILGAHGSDKEAVAKEIHRLSQRANKPFCSLNCRSCSAKQLEVELFGMEVNSQNESSLKSGMLERVNGGTLFIDELAFASKEFQSKLLKLLKDESFTRIGSSKEIPVNVRLLAGFPLDIEQLVADGTFNSELYYRLNVNIIKISPVSLRREDIPCLLQYFMEQMAKAHNTTPRRFSNEALSVLGSYAWPGDVAQMKSVIDWILTVSEAGNKDETMISLQDLPREITGGETDGGELPFLSAVAELPIAEARKKFEKEYLLEQLKRFAGNVSQTAKFVGMERSALHRKLRQIGVFDSSLFKFKSK